MPTLPTAMVQVLAPFVPLFSERVWQHALVLLAGTILAPGRRTVSSALRAMGLDQEEKRFHRYPIGCSAALAGRVGRRVACSWDCWWRRSCPKALCS
jgi:hypothetical protein